MKLDEIIQMIEAFAPVEPYEDEDSSGVQIRCENDNISTVLVCLEINDEIIEEAVSCGAELIVTHHPLIFYPVSRIEWNGLPDRYIMKAVRSGISVYSSHLPFDFAEEGNNAYLSHLLGLEECKHGFSGFFPEGVSLTEACEIVKSALDVPDNAIHAVDGGKKILRKVGFCTGAGGSMIDDALAERCDLFITGDLKLHEAQYAKAAGISVIDAGHYGTEKIFARNFSHQLEERSGGKLKIIEAKSNTNPYIL